MQLQLKKAQRYNLKARLLLVGLSGSGKTLSALKIAHGLVGDGLVAIFDSEHGSGEKYAQYEGVGEYMHQDIADFHPGNYVKLIKAAEAAGVQCLILDSLSHVWQWLIDFANSNKKSSPYGGWDKASPLYKQLIEAMLSSNMHIIATVRQKSDYVIETKENGSQSPKKVGMKADQRDGFEYEFDIVGELERDDHSMKITKTRCSTLDQRVFYKPGAEFAAELSAWLNGGVGEKPTPPPAPPEEKPAPKQETAPSAPKEASGQTVAGAETAKNTAPAQSGKPDVGKLFSEGVKKGWKFAQTRAFITQKYGIAEADIPSQLTADQAAEVLAHITNNKP